MAKNSIDSTINIADVTHVRYEGTLVSVSENNITFKYKKPRSPAMIQRPFPRSKVFAYGDDFIVVRDHARLNSRVFRAIAGNVSEDKSGWLSVDGIFINPEYAVVEGDAGRAEGSAPKKAKAEGKKAKKTK